ncbi:MAG TPA: 2Fe-2S iron-sulfur cluster-binding protein, partial [Roseiflexaceae bacterium]|nr:2Fe-2S iron-sulfur cluster-binding protein [Roseiflexaceae bacterium]
MDSSQPDTLVSLTINGQPISVPIGTTILDAAKRAGVDIPTICYHPNLTANAVCRLCTVEVAGARTLQPACVVKVALNMVVDTESQRV